jgi:hypothetical protein
MSHIDATRKLPTEEKGCEKNPFQRLYESSQVLSLVEK